MKLIAGLVLVALVVAGLASVGLPAPLQERPVGPVVRAMPLSSSVPVTNGWAWDLWATWPWAVRPWRRRGLRRLRRWWRGLRRWYCHLRRWFQVRREWQALLTGQVPAPPSAVAPVGGSTTLVGPNAPAAAEACAPAAVVLVGPPGAVEPSAAAAEGVCPPLQRRGRRPTIPTAHLACPHEGCRAYGCLGSDPRHHIVGNGTYRTVHGEKRQLLLCRVCNHSFSETAGTVLFGLKHPTHTVCVALQELAEGLGVRAVARIHGVEPDTVLDWLRKAGQHSERLSEYLMRDLAIDQVQLDELWTFVRKKERMLKEWERLQTEYGDNWIWLAFDPVHKLVLAVLIGEHEEAEAVGLLTRLQARLVQASLPLLTSDALPHYAQAILRVFGVWVQPLRKGNRGRHPKPRQVPPEDLQYATVCKKRQRGRVVKVTTRIVYGRMKTVLARLEPLGQTINTSFVERFNLTLRHLVSRLHRKSLCFSKKREYLVWHVHLALAYYHFGRPHASLRVRLPAPIPTRGTGSPKKWLPRTPAMAAGLTDHIWSMEELLRYHVPPLATP